MTENAAPIRRKIKSFVLRTGRMTDGQRRAYEINLAELGLQRSSGMQSFEHTFGRVAPVVLEIGFGMGDTRCGTPDVLGARGRSDECAYLRR